MGYNSDDKDENGNPTPRGEICVRGPGIMKEYYKDDKKTNEIIIGGWLHTGDVGELLPNGGMKIIDRRKNIFKLSMGTYFAPEKIEQALLRSEVIKEIFIHGDSLEVIKKIYKKLTLFFILIIKKL